MAFQKKIRERFVKKLRIDFSETYNLYTFQIYHVQDGGRQNKGCYEAVYEVILKILKDSHNL